MFPFGIIVERQQCSGRRQSDLNTACGFGAHHSLIDEKDIEERIALILSDKGADFVQLVRLAKLDPAKHFRYSNWSQVSFRGCNLRGFDFTGADLSNCDFTGANIENAIFENAVTTGSNLDALIRNKRPSPPPQPTFHEGRSFNGRTLTRADLAEAVFEKVNLPRNEAAELVEAVLKQIVYALERGEPIKLSSFGSFGLRQKSERVGRNPKTGEIVPITPRRVVVFKASAIMQERINVSLCRPTSAKPSPSLRKRSPTPSKATKAKVKKSVA
jgi:integration host factor subunit alpha